MRVGVVDAPVTADLRRRVLRPGWAPGSAMPGDAAPGAVHIAAFDEDGAVVGACLIAPALCPGRGPRPGSWQLRGMATEPDRRGQGVGAAVLAAAVRHVAGHGARLVWCNAREGAVAFYARHGFAPEGEPFVTPETGVPHLRMWRELPGPPTSSVQV